MKQMNKTFKKQCSGLNSTFANQKSALDKSFDKIVDMEHVKHKERD